MHYIAYIYQESVQSWVKYDDQFVTKLEGWKEVVVNCIRGLFMPTILFYEKGGNAGGGERFVLDDISKLTLVEVEDWER